MAAVRVELPKLVFVGFPAHYRNRVSEVPDRPTDRPCEDCGTELVGGPVHIDIVGEDSDVVASGESVYSDWCPNLDCLTSHVVLDSPVWA